MPRAEMQILRQEDKDNRRPQYAAYDIPCDAMQVNSPKLQYHQHKQVDVGNYWIILDKPSECLFAISHLLLVSAIPEMVEEVLPRCPAGEPVVNQVLFSLFWHI